jgi:arylsulfatase A-like enzyme
LTAFLSLFPASAQAQSRPNFVFIALDDLVPLSAGNLGDPTALLSVLVPNPVARHELSARITPNLNRLASRGVTFTQTWASYPLCNASRAALLTGISAARSGYSQENKYPLRDQHSQLRDATTLPQRLRQAGYDSLGLGKIFHFAEATTIGTTVVDWPDLARSWTAYLQRTCGTLEQVIPAPGSGPSPLNFGVEQAGVDAQPDWINAGLAATLLRDGFVQANDRLGIPGSMAINPTRPFFLAVGFRRPHTPWTAPKEFIDRVPFDALNAARINLLTELRDLSDVTRVSKGNHSRVKAFFGFNGSPREARGARLRLLVAARYYLGAAAFADACVGRVLDALDASPYARNTIVVLWSDHGYSWGQKLHFGKSSLWEPSLRAEFILADLRAAAVGRIENQPVSLVDIYPTVCALAGIRGKQPADGDGRSLTAALYGGRAPAHPILANYGPRQRAIRMGPWKYIAYTDKDELNELYNLRKDPFERRNLIRDNSKLPAIALRLKKQILRLTPPYPSHSPRPPGTPAPTATPFREGTHRRVTSAGS